MVGGVIWWVLREIKPLELCNPPITHCSVRAWSVPFFWPIDLGSIPKLMQQHIIEGGVIQWVLSEIPFKTNAILQLHHLWNELCTNVKCPISLTNWFRIDPKSSSHYSMYGKNCVKTWSVSFHWPIDFGSSPKLMQHPNMVGGVIWWVLSEIQSLELCYHPTTPCTVRTSHGLEVPHFFDQLILDRSQNLCKIITWWEVSFGDYWVKYNH